MLRHAEHCKTDRKPDRCLHHLRQSSLYTVADCPDGLYRRGAQFSQAVVLRDLRGGYWPVGMVFLAPGGRRLVVQGGAQGWTLKEAGL